MSDEYDQQIPVGFRVELRRAKPFLRDIMISKSITSVLKRAGTTDIDVLLKLLHFMLNGNEITMSQERFHNAMKGKKWQKICKEVGFKGDLNLLLSKSHDDKVKFLVDVASSLKHFVGALFDRSLELPSASH